MCRFLAYLGPAVSLESLLVAPEHSLLRQSWAPRFQHDGTVNADGFGVAWYDLARRPEPAVYLSARPMWGDRSFGSIAGLVSSSAVVAVVRDATLPSVAEESATPPFSDGPYLFAHNGAVHGFREAPGGRLRRMLTDHRLGRVRGSTDSEVLFGLVLDRLDAGLGPADALESVIRTVDAVAGGRMNLLLADGRRIAATAYGDSLYVREGGALGPGARVVASEPFDDDPAWRAVPEGSVLEVRDDAITIAPMEQARPVVSCRPASGRDPTSNSERTGGTA